MLRDLLRQQGVDAGRLHVGTLMKKMGIEAIYRRPNTSRPAPGDRIYPCLLRNLAVTRPNQVWALEIGRRYQAGGLQRALFEVPRPGKVPSLDTGQRQQVVALVCSPLLEVFARLTIRLLAEETVRRRIVPAIGREAIRVLLQSHDLKPLQEENVVRREAR